MYLYTYGGITPYRKSVFEERIKQANEYANQILAFLKQTEVMFLTNQVAQQNQLPIAQLQKLQVDVINI